MSSIRVLIVENELLLSEQLAQQLSGLGLEVTGQLGRGEDAMDHIATSLPDIVLMDIHLAGKQDGIETARQIRKKHKIPVIFLTDYTDRETFIRAIEIGPVNFISKPYNLIDLEHAIDLAVFRSSTSNEEEGPKPKYFINDVFFVKDKSGYQKVAIREVAFLEADRAYSMIHSDTGRHTLSISLNKLAEQINHPDLIRIHRSTIVNVHRINRIEGNMVVLEHGETYVERLIGKTFREDFFRKVPIVK